MFDLQSILIPLLALFFGGGIVYLKGRKDKGDSVKKKAAEDKVKRFQTREEIESEIQQDTDLPARARRSGSVRPRK